MNAYIYKAALYCEHCAIKFGHDGCDDSDCCPQGPYTGGGGEADAPQHCDTCGVFLENPLTSDGVDYVREAVSMAVSVSDWRNPDNPVTDQWADFYADALT